MNFLACCGVKKHCPKPQQKKQEYSPAFSVPFFAMGDKYGHI